MNEFLQFGIGLAVGVVSLATISVIISKKSDTPQVIQAGASALSNVVAAAVSPVQMAATNGNLGNSAFSTPAIANPFGSLNIGSYNFSG